MPPLPLADICPLKLVPSVLSPAPSSLPQDATIRVRAMSSSWVPSAIPSKSTRCFSSELLKTLLDWAMCCLHQICSCHIITRTYVTQNCQKATATCSNKYTVAKPHGLLHKLICKLLSLRLHFIEQ